MSLSFLGNGVCGCNGNCTCNEGFSGDICECRPIDECRNPVGGEVSLPCVYAMHAVLFVKLQIEDIRK